MTLECVASLVKFGPQAKEILLVSNNSSASELQHVKQSIKIWPGVNLIEYNQPFNYQKMNNWAAKQARGRFLLFLNNDTEFIEESKGLLEKMYEKSKDSRVGITGCLLLYGDRQVIQHAGVFLVPGGTADHLYVGKKLTKVLEKGGKTEEFPYSINEDRPLTAVTGAVSLVERKKFEEVGGFDERFIICGGDVDLCIRLNKAGYQTWYVAGGYILHKESQSRAFQPIPYNDFYCSFFSYIKGYDKKVGDPFLPKITEKMK